MDGVSGNDNEEEEEEKDGRSKKRCRGRSEKRGGNKVDEIRKRY